MKTTIGNPTHKPCLAVEDTGKAIDFYKSLVLKKPMVTILLVEEIIHAEIKTDDSVLICPMNAICLLLIIDGFAL
jgi:uncharacterized glyoxalase superfamily protein PhnB